MTTPIPPSKTPVQPEPYRPIYPSTPKLPSLPPHRLRFVWMVIGVMIAFLLVAGGVFGAYYYQSPLREEMLMSERLQKLKSAEFQLLLIPDSTTTPQQQVRISGAYNMQDAAQRKSRVSLQVMPSPESSTLTADAEMVALNELIYLRFLTLPQITQFNLQAGAEQWIKIDTAQPPVLLKRLGFFPNETTAEQRAATTAFQEHPFLRLERKVGTTTFNGAEVNRYPVKFDQVEFELFLDEVEKIVQQRVGTGLKTQALRQTIDDIDGITGEIWVGTEDHLPYRMQLSILRPDDVVTNMALDLSQHNQSIAINVPSQAKTVEEVLQQALGGVRRIQAVPQNDERVMNPALDSDDDGLTNGEEQDFATDPLKADTDGDGYLDGEEIENGFDPNGAGALK